MRKDGVEVFCFVFNSSLTLSIKIINDNLIQKLLYERIFNEFLE